MKKKTVWKSILSIVLSLSMVFTVPSATALAAARQSGDNELELNTPTNITVDADSGIEYTFTATHSGRYSVSATETFAEDEDYNSGYYIYNQSDEMIPWSGYFQMNGELKMVTGDLTAGETYYFYISNTLTRTSTMNICIYDRAFGFYDAANDLIVDGEPIVGSATKNGHGSCGNLFKVEVPTKGRYRFYNNTDNSNSIIHLYDSYGNAIESQNVVPTEGIIYTDKILETGTYYVWVQMLYGIDTMNYSASVTHEAYGPDTALYSVEGVGDTTIKLTWRQEEQATRYEIFRAESKNGEYKKIKTIESNTVTECTDEVDLPQQAHWYKMRSVVIDDTGKLQYGKFSNILSHYGGALAPDNVKVTQLSETKVKLQWDAVEGATSYKILSFENIENKMIWRLVGSIENGSVVEYTVDKLTLNKTYIFCVMASDSDNHWYQSGSKSIYLKDESKTQDQTQTKVNKINITGISKQIAAGKKITLKANIAPANATNKAVTWKSSNTRVATVSSSGVVSVKKKTGGKSVTITATAKDGSGKKAIYTIKSMKGVVKKITLSGKKSVKAGSSLKLKAKVSVSKGANKKLKWESSNTKFATVSSAGKVKTKKAGKGKSVKITVKSTDGSNKSKTLKIKIR